MYDVDYLVNIHHWPHGSFYQDLNPLFLPSNHLIWFETYEVMIIFNMLFTPNVLQKPILTIIVFFILCPNGKIKPQSRIVFQDVHIFNILKKKYIFNLTKNAFESCNLIHFNNDVEALSVFLKNHYYLSPLLSKWKS